MKSGEVVHIRVNPEDVMGCIDICKASNVYTSGMSLAQVVRLTLSGLLESARAAELIPRRDGFEYSTMVQPIIASGRNGKKIQISNTFELAEISRVANDLPAFPGKVLQPTGGIGRDKFIRRHGSRIDELNQKKDIDADNFTQNEQQELDGLIEELNRL